MKNETTTQIHDKKTLKSIITDSWNKIQKAKAQIITGFIATAIIGGISYGIYNFRKHDQYAKEQIKYRMSLIYNTKKKAERLWSRYAQQNYDSWTFIISKTYVISCSLIATL